jgi:uncharacterized protein
MLVQFAVSNFSSFNEEVVLNLIPAKSRSKKDHIIRDQKGKKIDVLPVAALYGANASGKTNFMDAIAFLKNLVVRGTSSDETTGAKPFLLDISSENGPSRFEIIFKHGETLYTYGIVLDKRQIFEEWLFAYFSSQESLVFERITIEGETKVKAGNKLIAAAKKGSQFIDFIAHGTRPNQPFVTEAAEKNISILRDVVHWFRGHLEIIRPQSYYRELALRSQKEKDFIGFLSEFLRLSDTGIENLKCKSEVFDPEKHLQNIPHDLRSKILKDLEAERFDQLFLQVPQETIALSSEVLQGKKITNFLRLQTVHRRKDGAEIAFDTSLESDGTQRLMHLVPMLKEIWEHDRVFLIDELDRSLHTHLSRLFIETCISGVIEKKARGQFIITTHDTNLLDRNLLRRDEIWFMEKDRFGASHLTSLADYKVSEGLNYENGYLNGRFGAIPFIGNITELLK